MQNEYIYLIEKRLNEAEKIENGFKTVLKTGVVAVTANVAYTLESKFFYGNEKFDQALVRAEMGVIGAVGTIGTAITVLCGTYTIFHCVKGIILSHKHNKIMQKENED